MKLDEIPSTTKEYWEKKKMARKKKVAPAPAPEADAQDMKNMDPQVMEGLSAMRGDPNLRPMGRKQGLRKEKGRHGEKLRKAG